MNYIDETIEEAKKSLLTEDVPIGALIVLNDEIISYGYNTREKDHSILGHAEINAIIKAEKKLKDFRLDGYTMITTLKPCKMCQAVIEAARISKVYYILEGKEDKSYPQVKYEKLDKIDEKFINNYSKLFNDFFQNIR